jgi:hypothetical protein
MRNPEFLGKRASRVSGLRRRRNACNPSTESSIEALVAFIVGVLVIRRFICVILFRSGLENERKGIIRIYIIVDCTQCGTVTLPCTLTTSTAPFRRATTIGSENEILEPLRHKDILYWNYKGFIVSRERREKERTYHVLGVRVQPPPNHLQRQRTKFRSRFRHKDMYWSYKGFIFSGKRREKERTYHVLGVCVQPPPNNLQRQRTKFRSRFRHRDTL